LTYIDMMREFLSDSGANIDLQFVGVTKVHVNNGEIDGKSKKN